MRGLKSFFGLLVVLIGLGAYLYFVESKRTPGDDEEKRDKVFTVQAEKIDEIAVTSSSGERTTLRKTGDTWQIVQPASAKPDSAEVSGLTSNLASVEIQRVIDENAADLKEYGLEPPRIEVAFTSGGQEHTLLIGAKTPPGSDLYARLKDQKRVFLIPSHLESTFNRSAFDLRDKAILTLDRDAIDGIEVTAGGTAVALAKADAEWKLTRPVSAPADFSAASSLVSRLTSAQMKTIETAPKPNLASYGLDKPAATVRVRTGSAQAVLQVGGPAGDGAVYARDESRPEIFTIEAAVLDELKKAPSEYRQKDLFDARSFNATRVEAIRGGQTVAFERAKVKDKDGKEEEKWRQVLPTAKDVDSPKVDALITTATGARAESFVDSPGKSAAPVVTLKIKYAEGQKEDQVTFLRGGADSYATRAGSPDAAKIDSAVLDSIVKALDEIK
jgi:hypothetical protein